MQSTNKSHVCASEKIVFEDNSLFTQGLAANTQNTSAWDQAVGSMMNHKSEFVNNDYNDAWVRKVNPFDEKMVLLCLSLLELSIGILNPFGEKRDGLFVWRSGTMVDSFHQRSYTNRSYIRIIP